MGRREPEIQTSTDFACRSLEPQHCMVYQHQEWPLPSKYQNQTKVLATRSGLRLDYLHHEMQEITLIPPGNWIVKVILVEQTKGQLDGRGEVFSKATGAQVHP